MKKISIDIGRSSVKVATSDGKKIKFSTSIAVAPHGITGVTSEIGIYIYNGERYFVGNRESERKAISIRDFDVLKDHTQLLIFVALEKLEIAPVNQTIFINDLRLGVAPKDYKRKNEIIKIVKEEFVVNSTKVMVNNVKVFAQGEMAMAVHYANPNDIPERLFVLDLGYETSDGLNFVDRRISSQGTFSESTGINQVVRKVQSVLSERLGRDISEVVAIKAMADKSIKFAQKNHDISSEVDEYVEHYVSDMINHLQGKVGEDLDWVDDFLICGGGAYFLEKSPSFQAKYPDATFIDAEYEFVNALGYLKA